MKKESKPIQNQDDKLINYNYKKKGAENEILFCLRGPSSSPVMRHTLL